MAMTGVLNKGYISSVDEGKKTAIVIPYEDKATVTHELVVPFYLWECLEVNMPVVYTTFADNTGLILMRCDGEWNHKIWQTVDVFGTAHITDGVSADSTMIVAGNVNIQSNLQVDSAINADGAITAPAVTGGGISLSGHVHGGVMSGGGTTSGPQ